jgi:hypothetical protein
MQKGALCGRAFCFSYSLYPEYQIEQGEPEKLKTLFFLISQSLTAFPPSRPP